MIDSMISWHHFNELITTNQQLINNVENHQLILDFDKIEFNSS